MTGGVRAGLSPGAASLVGLLLVLGLAMRAQPLLLMAGLVALTTAVAGLWGRHSLDRLEYQRSLDRTRCFVGEPVSLTVEVTNRKPLPVPALTLEELVPAELEIASRRLGVARPGKGAMRLTVGLSWYEKLVRRYTITPSRRGFYEIGPAVLSGADPFGYVLSRRELGDRATLIVYPKVAPLERFGLPQRRPFGDLRSTDRLFEDPLRTAGVREYRPGDSLNRIHWKASATTGRLQVRLLDPSAQPGVAILLNTWAFQRHWEGSDAGALETGCSLAASIAAWAAEQGLPAGLYANGLVTGWGFSLHLPPGRGEEAQGRILEGLARLKMPSRQSPADLLATAATELGYGTSIVYITQRVDDELAGLLWKVQRSGRPVSLIMVGEPASGAPAIPGVRVYSVAGEEALHGSVLA